MGKIAKRPKEVRKGLSQYLGKLNYNCIIYKQKESDIKKQKQNKAKNQETKQN